ncbi:uncharacterized protein PG986_013926 [Apiospora aurea]|uniref:Uncharacterized protein n=1 Tax=Apiospora aurea TaxID=335848 RepID=A0ABR1PX91_9PEZI
MHYVPLSREATRRQKSTTTKSISTRSNGVVLVEQNAGNVWSELGIPQCKDEVQREVEDDFPDPNPWSPDEMEYAYYRIQPFFAACEQRLRSLEWYPGYVDPDGCLLVDDNPWHDPDELDGIRKAFRDAGWFPEAWDKEMAETLAGKVLAGEEDGT